MKNLFYSLFLFLLSYQIDACQFEGVSFGSDFSAARLNGCEQLEDDRFLLTINPENHPINNSPWYAFKVTSKIKQKIKVSIKFNQGDSRYHPKISNDGFNWNAIPFRVKNKQLTFWLNVDNKPIWLAGQEIITQAHYFSWLKGIENRTDHQLSVLGKSTEGRSIYQLQSTTQGNKEWVVLLGRMHPPEVTGALALFPFSQELLLNGALSNQFRKRFNVLLIPNLNPDGVEHGHWRHNIKGVDLNRDWKDFKQKETQLVHNKLQEIKKSGGRFVYAIDFHSTSKDIFYTMPADYGLYPAQLTNEWLDTFDQATTDFKVINKPGNNPGKGVFKQYFADSYQVHAITYEMGDNTERKKINSLAKVAATTFMKKLLSTSKQQFYKSK